MSIELFDWYASLAFQVGEGLRSPPLPETLFENIRGTSVAVDVLAEAVNQFIDQHIAGVEDPPDNLTPDAVERLRGEGRKQFVKLYNVGVFCIHPEVRRGLVFVKMYVWTGQQYELADDVVKRSFPDLEYSEYQPEENDGGEILGLGE